MKEAFSDDDEEAIGTAVPEPSFGWLPDPAAHIRSSVSGTAAPAAAGTPAHHFVIDPPGHGTNGANTAGSSATPAGKQAPPQATQLRKGFLDRPRKRAAPATLHKSEATEAANTAEAVTAGTVAVPPDEASDAAPLRPCEAVIDVGTYQPTAGVTSPPPLPPVAASDPERTRRDVFRQLQPLCAALLPLRADATGLAPALRALQAALETADPVGLQAWSMLVLTTHACQLVTVIDACSDVITWWAYESASDPSLRPSMSSDDSCRVFAGML